MLTDSPPRKANRAGFLESDGIRTLDLPQHGYLLTCAKSIESAMKAGTGLDVRRVCAEFLGATSHFYKVPNCGIRVLAARPLRVRENWATELFGDYNPETMLIRVWMRTAVRKEITSFGILPPPRLSAVRVSRLVAYAWLLRAHRCALPPCAGNAAEAIILGGSAGRSVADRLAAHESRCLSLQVRVNFLDGGSSQHPSLSARWHQAGSRGGRGTNTP